MRKLVLVALILFGAGCGQSNPGVTVPYGSSVDQGSVMAPIAPYDPNSDMSRIAREEMKKEKEQEKEASTQQESTAPAGPNKPSVDMTKPTFPGKLPDAQLLHKTAVIETKKGVIEFEIFGQEAPLASSNFIYLASGGFYNGLTFHRREEGFVIQGGDPNGNGTGGPGYKFQDEPVKRSYDRGIVAMANAGPNTNGSQFFIMLADVPLPPNYTIFGKVVKGMEVVDAIAIGDVMTSVTIK